MSHGMTHLDTDALLVHRDFLQGLARNLLGDEHLAEDAVSDAWVAALTHPPREHGKLRSWLATTTRRAAQARAVGEGRRRRREGAVARVDALPSTAQIAEQEAVRQQVVEAVLALQEPYLSVILMRFYQDLPPREIARALGEPVETVRTRIKRGLAQLRERLDTHHGGDRSAWSALVVPLAFPRAGAAAVTKAGLLSFAGSKLVAVVIVVPFLIATWWWLTRVPAAPTEGTERGTAVVAPAHEGNAGAGEATAAALLGGSATAPEPLAPAVVAAPAGHVVHPVVTGTVLDASGDPLPGADVFLVGLVVKDWASLERSSGDGPEPMPPWVERRGTADADGRFRFEGLGEGLFFAGSKAPHFAVGAVLIVGAPDAEARERVTGGLSTMFAGWKDGRPRVYELAGDGDVDVRVAVRQAEVVSGHARTPDGNAVAGAEVFALSPDALLLIAGAADMSVGLARVAEWAGSTRSDDRGRYELTSAPGPALILARAPAMEVAQGTVMVEAGASPPDVDLTLVPLRAGEVNGVVRARTADGSLRPLADAVVYLTRAADADPQAALDPARLLERHGRPSVRTDEQGRFRFVDLAASLAHMWPAGVLGARSDVALLATAPGFVPTWSDAVAVQSEKPFVTLLLDAGAPLSGVVLDAADDRVLRGVRVTAHVDWPGGGPASGPWWLTAQASERSPIVVGERPDGGASLVEVTSFTPAQPDDEARGHAEPAPGRLHFRAWTDQEGRFELPALPFGTLRLQAAANGHRTGEFDIAHTAGTHPADAPAPARTPAGGQVARAAGDVEAAADAVILRMHAVDHVVGGKVSTPAGMPAPYELPYGDDPGWAVMQRASSWWQVYGFRHDPSPLLGDARHAEDGYLSRLGGRAADYDERTGRWLLQVPPAWGAELWVVLVAAGVEPVLCPALLGDQGIDFVVDPHRAQRRLATFEVRSFDRRSGAPLDAASVDVFPHGGATQRTHATYVMEHRGSGRVAAPGHYDLRVSKDGYGAVLIADREVLGGDVLGPIDAHLGPPASIELSTTLLTPDVPKGAPVPPASVSVALYDSDGRRVVNRSSDTGEIVFDGLGAGRYFVRALQFGTAEATARVDVGEGETRRIMLPLQRGEPIDLRFAPEWSTHVGQAHLTIADAAGRLHTSLFLGPHDLAFFAVRGYRLRVEAGRYVVRLRGAGLPVIEAEVDVVAGAGATVMVQP